MIDRGHELPLIRQAELLRLSRGSLYYQPRAVSAADPAIMRRIDELHLDYPFAGSRMLRDLLRGEGIAIGRDRVASMMRRMGIEALYRRPRTSKPADGHKIYLYLLRGLTVDRANQVWAMDITYIPMARGFVYLVAVVDWFSRRVLAWRVSITLDVEFCLEAVEEALTRYGKGLLRALDQKCDVGVEIVETARARGLLLNTPRADSSRFVPALTVSEADADQMLQILEEVMAALWARDGHDARQNCAGTVARM